MLDNSKKSAVIASLTSCGGCSQTLEDLARDFPDLLDFYEFGYIKSSKKIDPTRHFDLGIIEGHPLGQEQIELAKTIRRHAKVVVAIGSCAHIGGVYIDHKDKKAKVLSQIIRVDHLLPGCPIDSSELSHCLMDLYWGKIFHLPDLSVCFECRQNENICLLRKEKLCLGPVTRMGCNSICVNNGEACLGCRGSKPGANLTKMTDTLKPFITESEIGEVMTIFGSLDEKK